MVFGPRGKRKPQPCVIEDILHVGRPALAVAGYGVGKTHTAILAALCIATGKPFLGHAIPLPAPVLFLDAETDDHEVHLIVERTMEGLGVGWPLPNDFMYRHIEPGSLNGRREINRVKKIIAEMEAKGTPLGLICIDSWLIATGIDDLEGGKIRRFYAGLRALGVATLTLENTPRAFGDHPIGSVHKEGAVDAWFGLFNLKEAPDKNRFTFEQGKFRGRKPLDKFDVVMKFDRDGEGAIRYETTAAEAAKESTEMTPKEITKERIADRLLRTGHATKDELVAEFGPQTQNLLGELRSKEGGEIAISDGHGNWTHRETDAAWRRHNVTRAAMATFMNETKIATVATVVGRIKAAGVHTDKKTVGRDMEEMKLTWCLTPKCLTPIDADPDETAPLVAGPSGFVPRVVRAA